MSEDNEEEFSPLVFMQNVAVGVSEGNLKDIECVAHVLNTLEMQLRKDKNEHAIFRYCFDCMLKQHMAEHLGL